MSRVGARAGSARRDERIEGLRGSKRTARHINTVLVEVYRTPDDPAKYKEAAHYQTWRGTVVVPQLRAGCYLTPFPTSDLTFSR